MKIIFEVLIVISLVLLLLFVYKELWRNKDRELREILRKESKKNLNDLLGVTKTTFLALIVNLIIISIALLSFIETSDRNKETADINIQNTQILQNILERLENF